MRFVSLIALSVALFCLAVPNAEANGGCQGKVASGCQGAQGGCHGKVASGCQGDQGGCQGKTAGSVARDRGPLFPRLHNRRHGAGCQGAQGGCQGGQGGAAPSAVPGTVPVPKTNPKDCPGGVCPVPGTVPVPAPKASGTPMVSQGGAVDALDHVNNLRRARGLRPFLRDDNLTAGALACVQTRASRRRPGHSANDFSFLPAGTSASAAGCEYSPRSDWGACCTFDNYTYAGAAYVEQDGGLYCHIFVR